MGRFFWFLRIFFVSYGYKFKDMKKLILILTALVCVISVQAQQCRYSSQFGYVGYLSKDNPNLNGFRVAAWPQGASLSTYTNFYRGSSCVNDNNGIGLFGDYAFTPSNEDKTLEQQLFILGFIIPLFPKSGISINIGAGSKWNSDNEAGFVTESISTLGVTYISPETGVTISLGRQTEIRDIFTRQRGNFVVGFGYTIRK